MKNKKIIPIALLCLAGIALVAGGVLLGLHLAGGESTPADNTGDFIIDENADDYSAPDSPAGSENSIQIPGYPEIPMQAGANETNIALLNPEGNPCYFKFQIVLQSGQNGGEEVLYTSDWIPPGKSVSYQKLSRPLEQGTYPAIIRITTASLDESHSPMNGSDVKTKLIVK